MEAAVGTVGTLRGGCFRMPNWWFRTARMRFKLRAKAGRQAGRHTAQRSVFWLCLLAVSAGPRAAALGH